MDDIAPQANVEPKWYSDSFREKLRHRFQRHIEGVVIDLKKEIFGQDWYPHVYAKLENSIQFRESKPSDVDVVPLDED